MDKFKFPHSDWTAELVRQSLTEDIGSGDATTIITTDGAVEIEARIVARQYRAWPQPFQYQQRKSYPA